MALKYPLLIVNLKTYFDNLDEMIKIANIAKNLIQETKANIVLCPSYLSLKEISRIVPTFAQSIDAIEHGAHTGHVLAHEVKNNGAIGTLLNHSEKKISHEELAKAVEICKKINLISCVCAHSEEDAGRIARLHPDIILAEPPELIGGDISVTTANPDIVRNSVRIVKEISPGTKVLCGAGVKSGDDARTALLLGADGVGVASGIVKARDVEAAMRDIAGGLL